MTRFLACLAVVVPLCTGQPARISLYTEFSQHPPAAVLKAIETEVQSIMAPIGLSFEWLSLSAKDTRQVSVQLAVISFKGRCDVSGLVSRDFYPGALGWTHISDGVILPFADVDCGAVRSFIQRELLSTPSGDRQQAFGRALGRVLAHELYHIFANTRRHGSDGVAREFYSVHDLLAADFQFEARESMALVNSKARAAITGATATNADDPDQPHRFF